MEKEIRQLLDMGTTRSKARAALKQYPGDVEQAAERIFEGKFDHIPDDEDEDEDVEMEPVKQAARMSTPDDASDEEPFGEDEDGDDEGDYIEYDSDDGIPPTTTGIVNNVDPYAGIFFSKDRREEVIEAIETSEEVNVPGFKEKVKIMTQGQWMRGCPEKGEQGFLFSLYSQLSEDTCPCPRGCDFSISRSKQDFFAIYPPQPSFPTYVDQLRKNVVKTCPNCASKFCLACGETISEDKIRRPNAAVDDDPLFHCSNLQGVILGIGLSMVEHIYAEESADPADSHAESGRGNKRRKVDTTATSESSGPAVVDDADNVYYAAVKDKGKGGTGYAGDVKEDNSGQEQARRQQLEKDVRLATLLSEIRVFLPSLRRQGGGQTSDYLVHPTALAHLRRRFNFICSSLLRNDSLADMSDRENLYFELLEWLETISNHEALASLMGQPSMIATKSVTSPPHAKTRERTRTITYEGSSGPRELLQAIFIQAHAALKGLESTKAPEIVEMTEEEKRVTQVHDLKGKGKESSGPVADENLKLLNFCRRILATVNAIDRSLRETKGDKFVERLHASLPQISTSSSSSTAVTVDGGLTEASRQKAYMEWATRVRFEYTDLTIDSSNSAKDDELPHYKFYYNNEARMLANSDIPKRSLAIAKELAILTTNLPVAWDSSIFLRVDETRVDVIKALITGPEGAPYYNGCYLFDIFLGPSYNTAPPSVKYMTTNGGKYRFNPNLYADGKVCLSLLGTWSGPGWISGRSTLLQVLISIQSMILGTDEPYLNEPGWADSAGSPQSIAYTRNIRRMVVKTAMLGNLIEPPEPFQDIIRTHFRLKAESIAKQLDDWLKEDDGRPTSGDGAGGYHAPASTRNVTGSSSNGFKKDVEDLKNFMKSLNADV